MGELRSWSCSGGETVEVETVAEIVWDERIVVYGVIEFERMSVLFQMVIGV